MVRGTASDFKAHAVRMTMQSGDQFLFPLKTVTPEGVLLLARCHASATREGLRASSREHLPRQKLE